MDTEQLIQLGRDLESGKITQAEYEIAKAKIFANPKTNGNASGPMSRNAGEKFGRLSEASRKLPILSLFLIVARIGLAFHLSFHSYFESDLPFRGFIELLVLFSGITVLLVMALKPTNFGFPYHSAFILSLAASAVMQVLNIISPPETLADSRVFALFNVGINALLLVHMQTAKRINEACPNYVRDAILSKMYTAIRTLVVNNTAHANESNRQLSLKTNANLDNNAPIEVTVPAITQANTMQENSSTDISTERIDTSVYSESRHFGFGLSTMVMVAFFAIRVLIAFSAIVHLSEELREAKFAEARYRSNSSYYNNPYSQQAYRYGNSSNDPVIKKLDSLISDIQWGIFFVSSALFLDFCMIFFLCFRKFGFAVKMAGIWLTLHLASIFGTMRFYYFRNAYIKKLSDSELSSQEYISIFVGTCIYIACLALVYFYFSRSKRIQVTFGQKLDITRIKPTIMWTPFVVNVPRVTLDRLAGLARPATGSAGSAFQPKRSIQERLDELTKLKEAGTINNEEFDTKRKKLLDEL